MVTFRALPVHQILWGYFKSKKFKEKLSKSQRRVESAKHKIDNIPLEMMHGFATRLLEFVENMDAT